MAPLRIQPKTPRSSAARNRQRPSSPDITWENASKGPTYYQEHVKAQLRRVAEVIMTMKELRSHKRYTAALLKEKQELEAYLKDEEQVPLLRVSYPSIRIDYHINWGDYLHLHLPEQGPLVPVKVSTSKNSRPTPLPLFRPSPRPSQSLEEIFKVGEKILFL